MIEGRHLRVDAPSDAYEAQAETLLSAFRARDARAIGIVHHHHPRFLDAKVKWLPLQLSDEAIADTPLTLDDARLALARAYSYRDWDALAVHVAAIGREGTPERAFELAAEAVIEGDVETLSAMVSADPTLVQARSTRVTCHDPEVHRATLLHYLAANGVEGYRQRSPANAVAIARLLLDAGAEVDALAGMYGGEYATLSMLISSTPPADAGVQVPLVHTLLDYGAIVDGCGSATWRSSLQTALVFGFREAAEAVAERGAAVDDVAIAAGLDRIERTRELLPHASAERRHAALALAASMGNLEPARLLLEWGEDPNRFNPEGFHSHSTPLHQAALRNDLAMVRLLVQHGARTDTRDTLWHATPLGWAEHEGNAEVADLLRAPSSYGQGL